MDFNFSFLGNVMKFVQLLMHLLFLFFYLVLLFIVLLLFEFNDELKGKVKGLTILPLNKDFPIISFIAGEIKEKKLK